MAKKILIADDEPDIVKMLSMRLKAHGYEVIAAFDGLQAVREAYKERPDLILLDIKMPVGDGYKETGTLLGRRYKIIQRR
ncbi:response regulator [Candidatus Aerophobetes bacterium]|uniref:Response regulator n=1 Tax=Aerophobetes bacterium TaxID=2030807 RepID=A0A523S0A2_UNCAE|nr:MAG: response regulator [Candidatus Aerophobetes bacterium]